MSKEARRYLTTCIRYVTNMRRGKRRLLLCNSQLDTTESRQRYGCITTSRNRNKVVWISAAASRNRYKGWLHSDIKKFVDLKVVLSGEFFS
jgi:hypothetical protein